MRRRVALSRGRFAHAVGELLAERGWTQRQLADAVCVDPAHICRLLRRESSTVTPELAARVAEVLGVPPEFFAEYREWQVIEAVRADPALRDRLHRQVTRSTN